jgi:hypothetical protein
VDNWAAYMDCFQDMVDSRVCLALDMADRLVQYLVENEQAKEGTCDVEIEHACCLGGLDGPLEAHLEK